ncbi:response regulator transcription factor [Christensenella timonensis]|uniref:response regulator transcription factor n=1 Tax=Christensenella timonensis TaxID=1816678 RepID=UPI00082FEC14|nr:response regulator transcription factor [Christensenella timonensis]
MKLLIIEDEEDLLRALKAGFEKKGYAVDIAADGTEGCELAFINDYDLIILDLNLPGMDGLEILSHIRENDLRQKVLILSARSDYAQRIEGLDLGANDYLVKPFDFGELEARVRSLLRRSFTQNNVILKFSKFSLDTCAHLLYTDAGETIDLTPKEYAILEYLLLHRGKAISAEELIEHVWFSDSSLFSNAIKVHVSTLRKKLAAYTEEELVTNMRGAGYCILKPVQNIDKKLRRMNL